MVILALAFPEETPMPRVALLVFETPSIILFSIKVFTVPVANQIPKQFDASIVLLILPILLLFIVAPSTP